MFEKKKATSSAIRTILREHPKLKDTLRTMDGMRGPAREEALQASLGISTRGVGGVDDGMSELASAIERAVRGNRDGLLGLDWSVDDCPERE
jgi:zinc finger HIT domain-containing protein 3